MIQRGLAVQGNSEYTGRRTRDRRVGGAIISLTGKNRARVGRNDWERAQKGLLWMLVTFCFLI